MRLEEGLVAWHGSCPSDFGLCQSLNHAMNFFTAFSPGSEDPPPYPTKTVQPGLHWPNLARRLRDTSLSRGRVRNATVHPIDLSCCCTVVFIGPGITPLYLAILACSLYLAVPGLYPAVSGLYLAVPGYTGLYLLILRFTWPFLAILGCTWAVPVCTWLYWAVPGPTQLYWVVPGHTGMYLALLSNTGLYLGCTGLYLAVACSPFCPACHPLSHTLRPPQPCT